MENLVTAIIPVAEAHKHLLPRAVYSLEQQTYTPIIRPIPDHLGAGSAAVRNMGIRAADTPFLLFLDADDFLINTAIETMLLALNNNPEASYAYSDWIQFSKGKYTHHKSKEYDRKRQLHHSIHLVTTLIETEAARRVFFDPWYKGWEDWEFYIRMGLAGYCGVRVPRELLIYDMGTSINRVKHNANQGEYYNEIQERYKQYMEGEDFMACASCGGNNRQKLQLARSATVMPPEAEDGFVVMEYLGTNQAPVPYRVDKDLYRGANTDENKYIQAKPEHVNALISRGVWRRAPRAARPALVPPPTQFSEWRDEQPATQIPADWAKLFEARPTKDADDKTEEPKKRRGRKPGSKNRRPEREPDIPANAG